MHTKPLLGAVALLATLAVAGSAASAQTRLDRVVTNVWVVFDGNGKALGYDVHEGTLRDLKKLGDSKKFMASLKKKYGGEGMGLLQLQQDWCGALYQNAYGTYDLDPATTRRQVDSDVLPYIHGKVMQILCSTRQPDSKRDPGLPRKCMVERFDKKSLKQMYPPGSQFRLYYYLQAWYTDEHGMIVAGAVSPVMVVQGRLSDYGDITFYAKETKNRGLKELNQAVVAKHPELKPGPEFLPHNLVYHWDRNCVESDRKAAMQFVTWGDRRGPPNSKKKLTLVDAPGFQYALKEPGDDITWSIAEPLPAKK